MHRITHSLLLFLVLISSSITIKAQGLDVNSCPSLEKRNNGNGQYGLAAGDFRPTYSQNNPVAPNVTGTQFQFVPYDPQTKTGTFTFKWISNIPINNIPVVTRVWTTSSSNVTSLSPIVFGPPKPTDPQGTAYYTDYSFYVQNMPPAGWVTLEFTDPQTKIPAFRCTYSLSNGASAPAPADLVCTPTITSQPQTLTSCGSGTSTFVASSIGSASSQWQYSTDNGTTWNNISVSGNFTKATKDSLVINNRTNYNGNKFRLQLTNSCGTVTSNVVTLNANPTPTAVFASGTTLCGLNITRSISIALTGTGPWNLTYTTNGTPTTVSNITTSPYYLSVTPTVATTYIITSVNDSKCSNSSPTGATTMTINAGPSATPTNASICAGSSPFSLAYTATGSPTTYSISTGARALSGFSPITNASLTSSPLSVTIPTSGVVAGTYDFNMSVSNSGSGCVSTVPFTLTIYALPTPNPTAALYTICSGSSTTLSISGASTYSWSSNPAGYTSVSVTPTVSPTVTTTYTVTATTSAVNGSCSATGSVTVTVTPSFTVSVSSSPTTVCTGTPVTLTATGASTYSWAGPSSFTATGSSVVATPFTAGTNTYTVTATSASGCVKTATKAITVTNGPTLGTISNPTICYGASTTLTTSGATSYFWTPSTGLSATTGASVTASPTTTTTYTVYGTTSGCTGMTTVTVTVNNPVTSPPPAQVIYCAADLSGGTNNQLSFSFTSSSSVTCKWERNTTNTWTGSQTEITSTNQNNQYSRSETNSTSLTTSTCYVKTPGAGDQFFRLSVTSGSCTIYYYSQLVDLSTTPNITISSNQTICGGGTPTTLTSNGSVNPGNSSPPTTYAYQWQVSTTSATTGFTDIAGATSTTYSPGALSVDTWYRMVTTISTPNCNASYNSNAVKITIATAIGNNTISVADACVAGTQITGSTPTGGNGSFTYQWESSTTSSSSGFSQIANATAINYTPTVPTVTTWFRRSVSSGSCFNNYSTAIALYPPISSSQISNGQTVCFGTALTNLSVTPSGGDPSGSFNYLWYSSPDNSSFTTTGVTTSTYSPSTAVGTTYYRVTVIRGGCTTTSNTAKITVNAIPTISVTPSASTVCQGGNVVLTASGAANYTWSPATNLSASTGAIVTSTPTATRIYTITGSSTSNCSNTTTVTVTYSAAPVAPVVSATTKTICSTNAPFNLGSLVTSGTTPTWFNASTTNIANNISASQSTSGTYYVYSKSAAGCYSLSNRSVTLTVVDVTAPVTSTTALSVCSPNTADLTAIQPIPQSGVTLEWHTANSSPSGSNLVASPSSVGAGTYYLYAYSSSANCYGNASLGVVVSVNSLPTVSVSPSTLQACSPNTIDLTSTTSPVSGITYQWYTDNSTPPNSSFLVTNPTSIGVSGTYYVSAFNNTTGCISSTPSSVIATIDTSPILSITPPATLCPGSSVSISVSVTNGVPSPTYQWQQYDHNSNTWSNITNSGVYSGVTTNTLSISSNMGLDGTSYRCVVISNGCSTNSSIAVLGESIPATPILSVTQPTCSVATGTINVTSYSSGLTFSIDGGTSYQSSTTFSGLAAGSYNVIAKDVLGCISSVASATVNANPTPSDPTLSSSTLAICSSQTPYDLSSLIATGTGVEWFNAASPIVANAISSSITNSGTYYAYSKSNGCYSTGNASVVVTVTPAPSAGTLSGNQSICATGTTTFSSTISGGVWSTSDASIATINSSTGLITGISAGTATITYTITGTGGCSNATNTRTVTVTLTSTGTLSGTQAICVGSTTTFSSTVSGGTWLSNNASIASVSSSTGVVTGNLCWKYNSLFFNCFRWNLVYF